MNKAALFLAGISSLLLSTATLSHAAGQKTIFNAEKIKYESGTSPKQCQDKCGRRSGPDINRLLAEGWQIVSSSPKEVVAEIYRYLPCNTCEPRGCTCIGTEYILQRDEPARKSETSDREPDVLEINNRAGVHDSNVETSINELELLKKKNELLIKEISSLREENENLKNQLRSKQQ